jgi:thioredoxin 1
MVWPLQDDRPFAGRNRRELGGKAKIAKLNIDEEPEPSRGLACVIPSTLMIFKGGEVADIKVGALPKTALSHWINGAVA